MIELSKHHGLGNDFLIALNPPIDVGSEHAKQWCNRRLGIGADGLIISRSLDSPTALSTSLNHWSMTLWNADGSSAEISGNGIRCLAQAIHRSGGLPLDIPSSILVETDAGRRRLDIPQQVPLSPATIEVAVEMGAVVDGVNLSEAWKELGLNPLTQVGGDIGNPHLVGFFESIDGLDIAKIGSRVEKDYPGGLNVHVATVSGPDKLRVKHWERGAGVTQACGSGASVSAWAANRLGLVGNSVEVVMPGGTASVTLSVDGVVLQGPATYVGEVRLMIE